MSEKYCSGCKEKLEDGEVVAVSSGEAYHHISRDLDIIPMDCSMKRVMKGVAIFNRKVYYEGKFYNLSEVGKLSNLNELTIGFNEKNTGDIIKGDLKGLAKKLLGIF